MQIITVTGRRYTTFHQVCVLLLVFLIFLQQSHAQHLHRTLLLCTPKQDEWVILKTIEVYSDL